MDAYEATRIVFSRIQSLDPENASKIMGFLLIQDHGEKEMIRLAFGPETLLHSLILKAYKELGLSSSSINNNSSNQTTPSSPFPISRQNSSSSSSRLSSNNLLSSSWGFSDFQNYDNPNPPLPPPLPNHELIDEFQLQEQLSFLNEGMGTRNSDLFYPEAAATSPNWATASSNGQHRRSMSVTDICMGSDSMGSGFGWKPCLYYARGYCKNGTSCRFLHGLPDSTDPTPFPLVGSPSNLDVMDQCQELLLRSKTQQQQQRLSTAPQLLPSSSFPYAGSPRMLGEDVHQFGLGRSRIDRNELVNPGSRQIYLTFPADSTFREEDVSNYFSIYGPVQDVRIPYQQKRMFGFVTFVYPETVKLILAKGNPHFVCDARVLVKPYKEKGKVPDKKQQQQQVERGEFSAPTTPNGHDSYDMLLGMQMQSSPRLMYNNHDLILRRKLEEQAELQQAIELQSRRLIGLHLLDANKHQFHRRNLSTGTVPVPSPTHSHTLINQGFVIPTSLPDQTSPTMLEENSARAPIPPAAVTDQNSRQQTEINGGDNCKEETPSRGDCNFHDSVEHNLPDSPFASPTKSGGDASSLIFTSAGESERNISIAADPTSSSTLTSSSTSNNNSVDASLMPATSTIDVTSFKSCFLQIPRLSSGHGAVQM